MRNRLNDIGLLILRISFGIFMIAGHGWGKMNRLLSGGEIKFYNPFGFGPEISLWLAGLAEFFGSLLIVLGLFTRFGALAVFVTMAIAVFGYHFDDPFRVKEKALLYMFGFIVLFITGAGKYSVQHLLKVNIKSENKILRFLFS